MNLKEYQKFCKDLALPMESMEKEIMTWGLGIAGEAGVGLFAKKKANC